jgi:hypothetical protein
MIRDENTGLEVIDVHPLKSKILLVAKLLSGEVHTNMILESKETGHLFQVIGISFIPADAFAQAKRALTLKPIHHQEKLKTGEHLVSNSCDVFGESYLINTHPKK